MTSAISSRIVGFGRYAPARRIDNPELESRLDLEPGWIEQRTGIRSRRYASDDEAVTDLAVNAGETALNTSRLDRSDIALTLLATSTPDHLLPPSAPLVAHRLGLTHSGAVDLAGACAGFIYALTFADSYVRAHAKPVLVVGANVLSRRINPEERASAILFADAAGAVVLVPSDDPATGILGLDLASDGGQYDLIRIPTGGSRTPFSPHQQPTDVFMRMRDGPGLFAHAVEMMIASSRRALAAACLTSRDISRWIPHQANARLVEAVRRGLAMPRERVVSTIAEYGNSSAATIPFAMAAAAETSPYRSGERILLTAAGAGLTGGAIVYGS